MAWIEFHVKDSGAPVLVNSDQIVRIGIGSGNAGTFIRQADGSTFEVAEEYAVVARKLTGA